MKTGSADVGQGGLQVLGDLVEEALGGQPPLLVADEERQVLGHEARLHGLDHHPLQGGGEPGQLVVAVQLGPVGETAGPGEDGGDGVGGGDAVVDAIFEDLGQGLRDEILAAQGTGNSGSGVGGSGIGAGSNLTETQLNNLLGSGAGKGTAGKGSGNGTGGGTGTGSGSGGGNATQTGNNSNSGTSPSGSNSASGISNDGAPCN